jgi:hypothetical protein
MEAARALATHKHSAYISALKTVVVVLVGEGSCGLKMISLASVLHTSVIGFFRRDVVSR